MTGKRTRKKGASRHRGIRCTREPYKGRDLITRIIRAPAHDGGVRLESVIEFLRAVGRLKKLPRSGWLNSSIEGPESVAEHSYRTAILVMVLADLLGLDAEKAMKMALLHDLAEAETGDVTPEERRRQGPMLRIEEDEAMNRIFSTLPEPLSERYRKLWKEYRDTASSEAEVAASADKVEMLLQALEYEEDGVDPQRLDKFWQAKVPEGLACELVRALKRKRMSSMRSQARS